MIEDEYLDYYELEMPQEAFHVEIDLYNSGEYYNLLIIPCNDVFIVVVNNEHFTTMVQNGDNVDAWEQRDGQIEDEIFEKLAISLNEYLNNY